MERSGPSWLTHSYQEYGEFVLPLLCNNGKYANLLEFKAYHPRTSVARAVTEAIEADTSVLLLTSSLQGGKAGKVSTCILGPACESSIVLLTIIDQDDMALTVLLLRDSSPFISTAEAKEAFLLSALPTWRYFEEMAAFGEGSGQSPSKRLSV